MRTFARKRPRDDHAVPCLQLCPAPLHAQGKSAPSEPLEGTQTGRLARQDHSALSLHLDDMEYALEGLSAPRSSPAVLHRSALELLSLCAERKQRALLLRASGVAHRLVTTLDGVHSSEPLVHLSLSAVLSLLPADAIAPSVAPSFIRCLLRQLRHACDSSPPLPLTISATVSAKLCTLLERLDSPLSGEGCDAMRQWTRKRSVMALEATCATAVFRGELRKQGGVGVLLQLLEVRYC